MIRGTIERDVFQNTSVSRRAAGGRRERSAVDDGKGAGSVSIGSSDELATVDPTKQRIYLHFRGFLSVDQANTLKEAYRAAIARVGAGYTVVTIFEDFMPGTPEVQDVISSMILMASEAGCTKAARVSQGNVLGQMQLGRLQKAVQAAYPVKDCSTIDEADAYLDSDEE